MCVPELDTGKDCSGSNSTQCKSGTTCESDVCSKCCLLSYSHFVKILSYLLWAYLLVLSSLFSTVFFCESFSYFLWAYLIVLSPIVESFFVNPLATFCRRTSHPSPSSHCTVFFRVPLSDCAYLSKQLKNPTCCQFGF